MNVETASFVVNIVGDTTGQQFPGTFKVKRLLSHADHLEADRERRRLLGPSPEGASPRARDLANIFSELAVRVVDAPKWWTEFGNGLKLSDDNVVVEVHAQALKAEGDYVREISERAEQAKKDLQGAAPQK